MSCWRRRSAARSAARDASPSTLSIETVYSIILCPILWISHTIFLFGRLFNREIHWMGQVRDDHVVPFGLAMRDLWPQTLVGCLSLGLVLFEPAMGTALYSAAGRRAGVRRALRDGNGVACSRQPRRADRHRPPAGRDGNARGSARPCVARDHSGKPAALTSSV